MEVGTMEVARGKGTSVLPIPTSLMPVPERDAQSMERDCRSAGEHLKSSTKELQPLQTVGQLHWGSNSNTSMQAQAPWGINKGS